MILFWDGNKHVKKMIVIHEYIFKTLEIENIYRFKVTKILYINVKTDKNPQKVLYLPECQIVIFNEYQYKLNKYMNYLCQHI